MARDPSGRLIERLLAQAKEMDASLDRALDEAGAFEHFQMLRDRGLRGAESAPQVAGAARFAPRKLMNHGTTRSVGQGAECAVQA